MPGTWRDVAGRDAELAGLEGDQETLAGNRGKLREWLARLVS